MDARSDPLPGCTSPEVGCYLDKYLERRLTTDREEDVEAHLFSCSVCLAEVQLRQSLPSALAETTRPRRSRLPLWVSLAGAAATVVILGFFFSRAPDPPRAPGGQPFLLTLEGTYRAAGEMPRAPLGQPLDIALLGLDWLDPSASFSVEIKDDVGRTVLPPRQVTVIHGGEVRVAVPAGLTRAGRYEVILTTTPGAPRRFSFEVASQ